MVDTTDLFLCTRYIICFIVGVIRRLLLINFSVLARGKWKIVFKIPAVFSGLRYRF